MTDARLRELERRFRLAGSVENEAAWLRARVQAGDLRPSNLELAAFCGHEAARRVVARPIPSLVIEVEWLTLVHGFGENVEGPPWLLRILVLGGGDAVLRTAVALYRRSPSTWPENDVPVWNTEQRVNLLRDTTVAIEQWILSARDQAALARFKARIGLDAAVARNMARCVCPVGASQPVTPEEAVRELRGVLPFLGLDAAAATTAIRSELVQWALGYGDPLRERVEARAHQQEEADG